MLTPPLELTPPISFSRIPLTPPFRVQTPPLQTPPHRFEECIFELEMHKSSKRNKCFIGMKLLKKIKIYEFVKFVSDIRQLEHLLLDADRAFIYQMIENSQFEHRKKGFTRFHRSFITH